MERIWLWFDFRPMIEMVTVGDLFPVLISLLFVIICIFIDLASLKNRVRKLEGKE